MRNESTWYLKSEDIHQQWLIWKNSAEEISERTIPEKLALQIRDIAVRMVSSKKYSGYDESLKEDMVGDAIIKVFKNLKNMKEEKKDQFFNYITLCVQCSFYSTLQKHYKHVNVVRDLALMRLHDLQDKGMLDEWSERILQNLINDSGRKTPTIKKNRKSKN